MRYPELIRTCSTIDKEHGRLEQRSIEVLAVRNDELLLPGVKQIARLTRTREILKWGKTGGDLVLLITNLAPEELDAETLLRLKRSYWAIENKLHYRKDFTFGEDGATMRAKHGPRNMSALRNFAIGLLLANGIGNVKRCVDNLQHDPYQLLRKA